MNIYKKIKKYIYLAPLIIIAFMGIIYFADSWKANQGFDGQRLDMSVEEIVVNVGYQFNVYTDDNKICQTIYNIINNITYNFGLYTWSYWQPFKYIMSYELSMFFIFTMFDIVILPIKYFNKWLNKE